MKRLRFIIPFLVLGIFFGLAPACTEAELAEEEPEVEEAELAEEKTEEEVIEQPVEEEIVEEAELAEEENIGKFFEEIEEYGILTKAVDYASMPLEALQDWADGKISQEDVGTKYMEISRQVGKDYFLFDVLVSKSSLEKKGIMVTDDMEKVIELINEWSSKKKRYYEYMAKYYWGEGAEYEIEADKLEEEIEEIKDKYIELTNKMAKRLKAIE